MGLYAALAVACGPGVDADLPEAGSTSSTTGDATGGSTSARLGTSSSGVDTRRGDTTSPDAGFLSSWDAGPSPFRCSTSAQDCPPGQKCTLWADDGGPAYNASRCVDIAPNPAGLGEACTVPERSTPSGLDDCDLGLLCWYVHEGQGTCVEFCGGMPDVPVCPPDHSCTVSGAGVVSICVGECDPVAQDCRPGHACYPIHDGFACAPDASGRGGAHGDPCRFVNSCDPGLVCTDSDAHSACAGATGCCSTVCRTSAAGSDAACATLDPGQSCAPWFVPGMAPPGYEDIGVCATPGGT